jgi:hypothetical protein
MLSSGRRGGVQKTGLIFGVMSGALESKVGSGTVCLESLRLLGSDLLRGEKF